ncbi:MAG: right-handed parallel beta-helix repeat-containing protein [Saprospiraceae bacterium]|nr:right-handed parallel beta-helix repeat-containing protein [Saprospiraceae bacterium]
MNKITALPCLLALALAPCFLQAKTWYVATTGNDNQAGTLAAPFRTLEHAIDAANPGDAIELRGGTYASNEIRITKNNLSIRSYAGEWALLVAPLQLEDVASCIWYSEPDVTGGTLERLDISGGYYYGVSFETNWDWGVPDNQRHGASNITIRDCRIHHTGRDAIKIKPGCDGIQVLRCEIHHTGVGPSNDPDNPNAEGIDNVNGDNMVVRGCFFHDISTSGLYAKGGAQDCLIEENLVMNTGEAGILLGFYTDAEFFDTGANPGYFECLSGTARNNIVVNTGGAGIGFFAAKNCSAYHNTVVTASPKFHAPLYISMGDIWINDNLSRTPACENLTVLNNIFVDLSPAGDEDFTAQIRENGLLPGGNVLNHNLYQKPAAAGPQFGNGVAWPFLSLAEWRADMGFDLQSQAADPKLDAGYHLSASSPAIGAAAAIAAGLRDYDGATRTGTTDIGADQRGAGPALPVPPPASALGTGSSSTTTALHDVWPDLGGVQVFPNPATDWLFVRSAAGADVQLRLFDTDGRQRQSATGAALSVSGLPAGLYFLHILTEQGSRLVPVVLSSQQ